MLRHSHTVCSLLVLLVGCPQQVPPAHPNRPAAQESQGDDSTEFNGACADESAAGCTDPDERSEAGPDSNDVDDACPDELPRESQRGCPTDRDGDGIADHADSCVDVAGVPAHGGCPSETAAYLDDFQIRIRRQVAFEIDDEDIRPESFATLDDVARILHEHPEITLLRIEAHIDPPDYPRSRVLSRDRARAVLGYLVGRGVDRDRLVAEGYEGSRPIADPNGPDRALNRRIELHVLAWRGQAIQRVPP